MSFCRKVKLKVLLDLVENSRQFLHFYGSCLTQYWPLDTIVRNELQNLIDITLHNYLLYYSPVYNLHYLSVCGIINILFCNEKLINISTFFPIAVNLFWVRRGLRRRLG